MSEAWKSLFRIGLGLYWLYFASMKWQGVEWVKPLLQGAGRVNPIPGLHEFLITVVSPNWFLFAVAQSVAETAVAVLLILGLASRWAAILAFVLATNLALTVAFELHDPGFRWMYYLAVLAGGELIVAGPGAYAMARFKWMPRLLR